MPNNQKYFRHQDVLLVTARTEHGLPLAPSYNTNFLINGILAKASSIYQVKVCHYIFMGNHLHMILVVDNPQDVSLFMGYVKSEISHIINLQLGRWKHTNWAEGYDSPVLLTAQDVIRYIVYLYANPARAGLTSSIEQYPGVSSWRMFRSEKHSARHKRISRPAIRTLDSPALGVNEQKRIVEHYKLDSTPGETNELTIEPFAWMECFEEFRTKAIEEVRSEILAKLLARIIHEPVSSGLRV